MSINLSKLERTQKLASKSSWIAGLLTFIIVPVGYIYTGRFKAMFTGIGIAFGLTALCIAGDPSLQDDEDFINGMVVLYTIGATVDNARAVSNAKKQMQEVEEFTGIPQNLGKQSPPNLKLTLLKFLKQRGVATLADCVIETGEDTKNVRKVLQELVNEELISVTNRDSDGAVLYRVI
jgi:hypothetical protein